MPHQYLYQREECSILTSVTNDELRDAERCVGVVRIQSSDKARRAAGRLPNDGIEPDLRGHLARREGRAVRPRLLQEVEAVRELRLVRDEREPALVRRLAGRGLLRGY